jgi:hypothetical protein
MFELGAGVERNLAKAIEWMQKGMLLRILQNIHTLSVLLLPAAEAGDSSAQYDLIKMLRNWNGVEAIPVGVFDWIHKGLLSQILQNINALNTPLLPVAKAGDADAQIASWIDV